MRIASSSFFSNTQRLMPDSRTSLPAAPPYGQPFIVRLKAPLRAALTPLWLSAGGANRVIERVEERAIILMYHSVVDRSDCALGDSGVVAAKNAFCQQMKFINERMRPVPLSELVVALAQRRAVPTRAVAVTFDDGYEDNYLHAFPVLRELGIPATIFLTTGHIESSKTFWWDAVEATIACSQQRALNLRELATRWRLPWALASELPLITPKQRQRASRYVTTLIKAARLTENPDCISAVQEVLKVSTIPQGPRMLGWKQIAEMSAHGIEFGAHTVSHPDLTQVTAAQALRELGDSKDTIESRLKAKVLTFAYPYGTSSHWTPALAALARKVGFHGIATADSGAVTARTNVHRLPRLSLPRAPAESAWTICKHLGGGRR
jgi:peptidoglycan/xylan/chitin deacetylase (PgdA/CDA1 family)